MHGLKGPEIERQVLDAVRAAVVKVHARGHLGPRAAGQRPGPDRAARAARPRHAESSADGTRGLRDARPPPRAAPAELHFPASTAPASGEHFRVPASTSEFRRAPPGSAAHLRVQSRTSGRRRPHSWASLGWTLPAGLRGELMVVSPEMFSAARRTHSAPAPECVDPAAAPPGPHVPGAAPGMPCARGSFAIVRRARNPERKGSGLAAAPVVPAAVPFLLGPRPGPLHLRSPWPSFSLRGSVARRLWVLGPTLGRASAASSAKWAFRKLRLPRDPVLGPNVVSAAELPSASCLCPLKTHLLSQTLGTRAVASTCSAPPSKSRARTLICGGRGGGERP